MEIGQGGRGEAEVGFEMREEVGGDRVGGVDVGGEEGTVCGDG